MEIKQHLFVPEEPEDIDETEGPELWAFFVSGLIMSIAIAVGFAIAVRVMNWVIGLIF